MKKHKIERVDKNSIVFFFIVGLIFFTVVSPIGIILRFLGYDPLKLKKGYMQKTFWIHYLNE